MPDDPDLTARFNALREVLTGQIASSEALAAARMDGMDAARRQYLEMLGLRIDAVRELAEALGDAMQHQVDRRLDAITESGQRQLADLRTMLNERYETQTKALDAAFKAAEQAVQTALVSAEKAVGKAEVAADKRFDSVNEFRQTLADQATTFMPRSEYDAAHKALDDRVAGNAERVAALELRLTSRLDRGEGTETGAAGQRSETRLNVSQVIAFLAVVAAAVSVILLALKK